MIEPAAEPVTDKAHAGRAASGFPRSFKALAALGVFGAAVLAVNANVLVARWYKRWDLTADRLYTLSVPTREILHSLDSNVDVVVFLSKSDPLSVSVRQLLAAYRAETSRLTLHFVDPEQNPAEFAALQPKLGILSGRAEDGRVLTDASIVVTRGERRHYITNEEIVHYDDDTGRARPRLEQALTEGIANVLVDAKSKICFSTGHRELSLDDLGPEGLSEIRQRLTKNNFDILAVDLASPQHELAECRVLVIAGPSVTFEEAAANGVSDFVRRGGNLLLLAGPVVGEDQRVNRSGLESVAALIGTSFGHDFVLETDAALRLPRGAGEIFFAVPKAHALTKGLQREGVKIDSRVLVSSAQSLSTSSDSPAVPVLVSSDQALRLHDLSSLLDPKRKDEPIPDAPRGACTLAVAAELPKPVGSTQKHGARVVLAGATNLIWGRNYRDASLYGNRLLIENAMSWLAARPAIISVPEKPAHDVGLSLSDESLGEVLRYVLVYMPGSAILVGAFVLLRRRAVEKKSRQGENA